MIRKCPLTMKNSRGNQCVLATRAVVSSIETLLGPGKSLKCYQSSGTSVTTSSTCKILESIDVEHPVGFIINDVCQSFQKQFGCGCTTLVCLIGYWSRALQGLVEKGIPVPVIGAMVDEALEELENTFENSFIPLKCHQDEESFSLDFENEDSVTLVAGKSSLNDCFSEQLTPEKDEWKFTKEKKEGERNRDLDEIRDRCDDVLWYFDRQENVGQPTYKDSADSRDTSMLTIHAFPAKSISDEEQCNVELLGTDRLPDAFHGKQKLETKSHKLPLHNRKLKEMHSVDNNILFSIVHAKPPKVPEHRQVGFIDDFEDCFSDVTEKVENVKIAESPSRQSITELDSGSKNVRGTEDLTKLLFPQLLKNKVLPERKNCIKTSPRTDISKVFLRSRHLVDVPALTKPLKSVPSRGTIEFSVINKSVVPRPNENDKRFCKFDTSDTGCERSHLDVHAFALLARNLAHGKDEEMKFALEVLQKQYNSFDHNTKKFSFSLDYIAVQTVFGPPNCDSCVLNGVVVMLSERNQLILRLDCHTPRRIMLVNGDIAFNYRHAGFKAPVEVTRVFEKENFLDMNFSERSRWMRKVTLAVRDQKVRVVAARGNVDGDLVESLQALGIVVLENLNHHQIEVLSKMTNTPILSYPLDIESSDAGKLIVIRVWVSGMSFGSHQVRNTSKAHGSGTITFGQIDVLYSDERAAKANVVVQTLVVCGPVEDLVTDSELKFWNCVNRLRNALDDQRVLPGGGEIERRCIERLEEIKGTQKVPTATGSRSTLCPWISEDCVLFKPLICDALIEGLKEFISRVNLNSARDCQNRVPDNETVFDNYVSKIEGWKRAIRVVKLLLCSEYHIITGI